MTTHHTTKTCRPCRNRFANGSKYGDPIGITPPGDPRLPWGPLDAELTRLNGGPVSSFRAEQMIGYHADEIRRWRTIGVRFHVADTIAVRLGCHPADLWPEYWSVGFHDCPHRPDTWLDDHELELEGVA